MQFKTSATGLECKPTVPELKALAKAHAVLAPLLLCAGPWRDDANTTSLGLAALVRRFDPGGQFAIANPLAKQTESKGDNGSHMEPEPLRRRELPGD